MTPGQDTWSEELPCGCVVRHAEGDQSYTAKWCADHERPLGVSVLDEAMLRIDELVSAPTEEAYQKARQALKRYLAVFLSDNPYAG